MTGKVRGATMVVESRYPFLQPLPRPPGVSAALRRRVVAQFGRPSGWAGRLAGILMAHRPSNIARNRFTVELLGVQPGDRVLEIGFGPGISLQHLHALAPEGLVTGIDHSVEMLRQAARRNSEAIASGRMILQLGSVTHLPAPQLLYDRIMAVNNVMFWEQPTVQLRRLIEQLRPDGTIALTSQPRGRGVTQAETRKSGERLAALLKQSGFRAIQTRFLPLDPVDAVCVTATR